jgi:two-component system, response regulator
LNRKHFILIAEDDEDDYILVRDAFMEFCVNTDIYWVKDGEELMDYLLHRGQYSNAEEYPRPGIILLDLNMPKTDGREALKQIKEADGLATIPIVALTTSNSDEDVAYTYRLGINSYIRKPSGYGEFVDVMKVFNKYWNEIVRLPATH